MSRRVQSAAIFVFSGAVTSVFFINFCATVFRCGCDFLWTTASEHCNIHIAGAKHCPWCVYGYPGFAAVFGTMIVAQAAASFLPEWGWPARLALSLLAFPVSGGILAGVLGIWTGYWY